MTSRPARRVFALLAASLALAGAVLVPTAAVAETDDDSSLNQTIDPNQTQGTGQIVLDKGHVDFGPTLNTGEWIVQIHDDTASPSYWRMPEDVVLKVNDSAILSVPDSEAYGFLGQEPGTQVWVVPQTRNNDVVWAGWNTQEPNVLEQLNLGATLSMLRVEGPGDVIVYLQSGNFGDPQQLWSTLEPFPQQSWIEVNIHTHANWVFTQPGVYLIEVQFEGQLISGETVTATDVLRFAVGDSTDPQPAFSAQLEETTAEDDDAAADTAQTDAAPTASEDDGSLGTVIWIVAGAVGVALILALILISQASRRAKARALAARENRRKEPTA